MLVLDNITLICVSGVDINNSLFALWRTSSKIKFAEVKFVSFKEPAKMPVGIKFEKAIDSKLETIDEYNKYCVYKLHNHVSTEFCLIVQHDGFVINPTMWDPIFLNFDYIGAPWPLRENNYLDPFGNHQRVGNGGFSLRSKRLLTVPLNDKVNWYVNEGNFYKHFGYNSYSEDVLICVHNKHIYKRNNCTFAPLNIACLFSFEQRLKDCDQSLTFGFHGQWPNLLKRIFNLYYKIIFKIKMI